MSFEQLYPPSPSSVPQDLTRSTPTYRLHAWLAMGCLVVFVVLYLGLTAWFGWMAYRSFVGIELGGDAVLWRVLAGGCAGFLAVFMFKALLFVSHRYEIDDLEVTAKDQPELFAFINRLADEIGAPRAHRVFLSPEVNAAVFYDLTVMNLLFPSRKNLKIGLALVNSLSLGELKAVLAHEFAHFAQRSMAVGRWVYMAQQIAAQIISKRDALDSFLRSLSRFDLRVAWVGWLLSIIIWSIRSLMETVFRLVVLAQRALSREMELQADLVAVSVTGSDALIHALHKLGTADQAWGRAIAFAESEAADKRLVSNLFAVQTQVTAKLREILDDPSYGEIEPLPTEHPEQHRVFKSSLGQPPRMWSTHPTNFEREQNAKRIYIAADIDARSAWELFDDAPGLQQKMTAHILRSVKEAQSIPLEESLIKLTEKFQRAYYDRAYRGAYLSRNLTQHYKSATDLHGSTLADEHILTELGALYPDSLADDLDEFRELEEEHESLKALQDGFLTAPGGIIRYRGKELRRADLKQAIEESKQELEKARGVVLSHDKRCRSVHLAAARQLGNGWEEYLKGMISLLHYAEHNKANLQDAYEALRHVLAVVTADGRVSSQEREHLRLACVEVHNALRHIYIDEGRKIRLDESVLHRLGAPSWQAALGELKFPEPDENNMNAWLGAVDGWVHATAADLSALAQATLEQLLLAEGQVAHFIKTKTPPDAAPAPSFVPPRYPVLVAGEERPRQKKLDLWDRFHVADGVLATLARLAVACGIIVAVLSMGSHVSASSVNIYNGLGRTVNVTIGTDSTLVPPFSATTLSLSDLAHYSVKTTTESGAVIEEFTVDIPAGSTRNIYNVAGATALVEWTAVYGKGLESKENVLGAERWTTSTADYVFKEPPQSIKGEGTRRVVAAYGNLSPSALVATLTNEQQVGDAIAAHATWDGSDTAAAEQWLEAAATRVPDFDRIIRTRLALQPDDVLTLRAEQDYAPQARRVEICQRHRAIATERPDNMNLQYIAARCIEDDARKDRAFEDLHARAPTNTWLTLAVMYTRLEHAQWQEAVELMNKPLETVPVTLRESVAMDNLRVRRLLSVTGDVPVAGLKAYSDVLQYVDQLELSNGNLPPGRDRAYYFLGHGSPDLAVEELEKAGEPVARVLRLAAASDGADAKLVAAALKLPATEGVDGNTLLEAIALALRERADAAPYIRLLEDSGSPQTQKVIDFIMHVRRGGDVIEGERILDGVDIRLRAHAYSAALILQGERAPAPWRRAAVRMLFVFERPYFEPAAAEYRLEPTPGTSTDKSGDVITLPRMY